MSSQNPELISELARLRQQLAEATVAREKDRADLQKEIEYLRQSRSVEVTAREKAEAQGEQIRQWWLKDCARINAVFPAAISLIDFLSHIDWPYVFSAPNNGGSSNADRMRERMEWLDQALRTEGKAQTHERDELKVELAKERAEVEMMADELATIFCSGGTMLDRVKAAVGQVRRYESERDDLHRQLEEARTSDPALLSSARYAWAKAVHECAQWQSVAMKRREALAEIIKDSNTYGIASSLQAQAEATLSLDPPTALLEIVEAALMEGYRKGIVRMDGRGLWAESETRKRVMGK